MAFLPIITIPILYLFVAVVKPVLSKWVPWNICAICTAVSLSWVSLLVMWLAGLDVDTTALGILMGMSVTGLMYKAEQLYATRKIRNFWFVRLVIVVGGYGAVLLLLETRLQALTLVAFAGLFAILIPTFFFQRVTHETVVKNASVKDTSLLKKLENCC